MALVLSILEDYTAELSGAIEMLMLTNILPDTRNSFPSNPSIIY